MRGPPGSRWPLCALATLLVSTPAEADVPRDGVDAYGVPFKDGFPVTRPDRLFPYEQVRRGQKGVGYTVFEEDRIEPFGVEILGVLEGLLGPGEDVILVRLTGEKIAFTGVISGMSGSPVFVDGRLLGAVAYRFGSFAKEPIAGITPIQRMLPILNERKETVRAPRRGRRVSARLGRDLGRAPRGATELLLHQAFSSERALLNGAAPIATPVAVSGLHPAALARLQNALGPAKLLGSGAGRGPDRGENATSRAGRVSAAPIRPGAPIAALLTRGDVNLAAIGTVTYVHGSEVLGFGHPFVGHGAVAYPLATASILNTLASEAGSYKQGLAAREVGIVSQDRLTAISGRIAREPAPLVPLEVFVWDRGAKAPARTFVEMAASPVWLSTLTDTVVSSAVLRRIGAEAGGTAFVKMGFEVGDRYLEVEDAYAAPAPLLVAAFAARDVAAIASIIGRNDIEPADIKRVRVDMRVSPDVKAWRLESASLEPVRVRPGQTVQIVARLRPYRGQVKVVRLNLEVPSDAPSGPLEVYVGGGVELDRRDSDARGDLEPKGLDDLLGILAERRPGQSLFARIYLKQPGLRIGTRVLPALPPSQQAALAQPGFGANTISERPGPETRQAMDGVVSGALRLEAEVVNGPQDKRLP